MQPSSCAKEFSPKLFGGVLESEFLASDVIDGRTFQVEEQVVLELHLLRFLFALEEHFDGQSETGVTGLDHLVRWFFDNSFRLWETVMEVKDNPLNKMLDVAAFRPSHENCPIMSEAFVCLLGPNSCFVTKLEFHLDALSRH